MARPAELAKLIAIIGAVILAYGGFIATWALAFGGSFPDLKWWQYLAGAFVLGLVAIAVEAVFLPVQRLLIDPDRITDPRWKRSLRAIVLIALGFAFVIGAAVLRGKGIL
jgi:hypothetical protein